MVEGFQRTIDHNDDTGTKLVAPEWDKRVFIGTMKTMNVGLTLTEADKVILLEPNPMPTDELQAMHRAIRIGQTRTVYVTRLTCPSIGIEAAIMGVNDVRSLLVSRAFEYNDDNKGGVPSATGGEAVNVIRNFEI